jgi:hypothetical protein
VRKILLIIALGISLQAVAQDAVIVSKATYYTQTKAGQYFICGIDFSTVYRDNTYRQGGLSAINGSLSWMETNGNFDILVKVAGVDLQGPTMEGAAPFSMDTVHLAIKDSSVIVTRGKCEDARFFCGIVRLPDSMDALDALRSHGLQIGFNRQANGLDEAFPIDGSLEGTSDKQAIGAFRACELKLLDLLRQHLE